MMNGLQAVESWHQYFGEPKEPPLACSMPHTLSVGYAQSHSFPSFAMCLAVVLASQLEQLFVVSVQHFKSAHVSRRKIAHPAHRTTATALFNTSYALGSIVAGWATFGTFRIHGSAAWRIPSALQCLPSVIQLCGLYFVPESPRWLISKYRSEEALAFLAKYHAEGEESHP